MTLQIGTTYHNRLKSYSIMVSYCNAMKAKTAAEPILGERVRGFDAEFVGELWWRKLNPEFVFQPVPIPERNQNILYQAFFTIRSWNIIFTAIHPFIRCPVGDMPLDIELH